MSDANDYVLQLYDEQLNKLIVNDIRDSYLHQYVHQFIDVEPATFHHHHGPDREHDILYHDHDGDPGHRHYIYNPAEGKHYDDYANAHHGHGNNDDDDGGATEHGA